MPFPDRIRVSWSKFTICHLPALCLRNAGSNWKRDHLVWHRSKAEIAAWGSTFYRFVSPHR